MHLPWSEGSSMHSAAHPWPLMVWTIFWFLILYGLLPLGAGLCLIVGFSSFSLLFCSFHSLATIPAIPLCYSCRGVIWLVPAGPLWAYCLFFSQWLNMVIGFILMLLWAFLDPFHCLWALLSHFFLLEHPWPIYFPWASLARFLILHTHGLLLTSLDFPDPITLFLILGALGLPINPLLSYFITSGLLWPILTLLHHIIPMGFLLLFLDSFRPIFFPQVPVMYFMGLWTTASAIQT